MDGEWAVLDHDRNPAGEPAHYLLPMKDGAPTGANEFVRFGNFENAHTSLPRALVYEDHVATWTEVNAYLVPTDSMDTSAPGSVSISGEV